MLKKATTTRTAKGFDGFSLLGRIVVRGPWLVIAAWIAASRRAVDGLHPIGEGR